MKTTKIMLPIEQKVIEIIPLSDWHIGSQQCKLSKIQEDLDYIKSKDNVYAICLGDLVNNSIKSSVGDVYSDLSPRESVQMAIELLKPIRDRILFAVSGNHEQRSYKETGQDLSEHIFFGLDLLDRYDAVSGLVFLIHGFVQRGHGHKHANGNQQLTTIYCTHGGGGGRALGGKVASAVRRADIIDADIVLVGHTHEEFGGRPAQYRIDRNNYKVELHEQLVVNASSSLGYEPYAERNGMRPTSTTTPRIILEGAKQPRVLI